VVGFVAEIAERILDPPRRMDRGPPGEARPVVSGDVEGRVDTALAEPGDDLLGDALPERRTARDIAGEVVRLVHEPVGGDRLVVAELAIQAQPHVEERPGVEHLRPLRGHEGAVVVKVQDDPHAGLRRRVDLPLHEGEVVGVEGAALLGLQALPAHGQSHRRDAARGEVGVARGGFGVVGHARLPRFGGREAVLGSELEARDVHAGVGLRFHERRLGFGATQLVRAGFRAVDRERVLRRPPAARRPRRAGHSAIGGHEVPGPRERLPVGVACGPADLADEAAGSFAVEPVGEGAQFVDAPRLQRVEITHVEGGRRGGGVRGRGLRAVVSDPEPEQGEHRHRRDEESEHGDDRRLDAALRPGFRQ